MGPKGKAGPATGRTWKGKPLTVERKTFPGEWRAIPTRASNACEPQKSKQPAKRAARGQGRRAQPWEFRELRKALGYTQRRACDEYGLKGDAWRYLESGRRRADERLSMAVLGDLRKLGLRE